MSWWKMRKMIIRLAASVAIGAVIILWLSKQGFEVLPTVSELRQMLSYSSIAVYTALFTVFHVLRAWRWSYLLRPFARVSSSVMMEVAFTGFAAIQMMPLRTGEVVRPYLLERHAGVSKSALFGTIAIERLSDGFMVSLCLTAALLTISAESSSFVWSLRIIPLSLFAALLIVLVAFYVRPKFVSINLGKLLGIFSSRLSNFAVGVLDRFHAGLAALPNQRYFWTFIGFSWAYWGINALSFYLLAVGCGVDLPFVGAVAGMGCLAVGILLPAGPGYFGNFQAAVLAALNIYIPMASSSHAAAVFIFALYVLQTGLTLLFGILAYLRLRKRPIRTRTDRRTVTEFSVSPE